MRADHEDTARGSREAQGLERYLDSALRASCTARERSGARCRRGDLGTPLTPYESSCASLIWHHLGVSRRDLASLYVGVLLGLSPTGTRARALPSPMLSSRRS